MQDISPQAERLSSSPGHLGTEGATAVSRPLWSVLAGGIALSVALVFGLRAAGRDLLGVPSGLPSLATSALLPAAIAPVLGNCFGYFMSFRARPNAHSMSVFLGFGAVMALVGIAISANKLPASSSAASVAITVAVSLVASVLSIAGLLLLVPRSRRPG
jgi:hypothetical protein